MTQCQCLEGMALDRDGARRPVSGHDCGYVAARNALIPEAALIARRKTLGQSEFQWTAAFSAAMDELARERIYQKP